MTCFIRIELPGLNDDLAPALSRRADVAGVPLLFLPGQHPFTKRGRQPSVTLNDLDEDPSIASETLDHPSGWPQSPEVRRWLTRTIEFLASSAPNQRFTFQAGWDDFAVPTVALIETELSEFIASISSGALIADQRYEVRTSM